MIYDSSLNFSSSTNINKETISSVSLSDRNLLLPRELAYRFTFDKQYNAT